MQIDVAWLFGIPVAFLLGLFIGEKWQEWSAEDDPVQMDEGDEYLQNIYKDADRWIKGE